MPLMIFAVAIANAGMDATDRVKRLTSHELVKPIPTGVSARLSKRYRRSVDNLVKDVSIFQDTAARETNERG
ncbi:MAG: hypothetical protein KJZ87_03825, partial [Thermoguttaceae bacterium]|nr:hypothetical protein [Thermoguttaceae bacterium]